MFTRISPISYNQDFLHFRTCTKKFDWNWREWTHTNLDDLHFLQQYQDKTEKLSGKTIEPQWAPKSFYFSALSLRQQPQDIRIPTWLNLAVNTHEVRNLSRLSTPYPRLPPPPSPIITSRENHQLLKKALNQQPVWWRLKFR